MELDQYSRIIFISIVDLQKIRFSKLEQVCDGVYVFVDKEAKMVPFFLVQQLQHLGESVKWIAVNGNTSEAILTHISFYLGKLHEQMETEVEFAIISEDTGLDNLIQYINDQGRGCIRVTKNKQKEETTSDLNGISWTNKEESPKNSIAERNVSDSPKESVAPKATVTPTMDINKPVSSVTPSNGNGAVKVTTTHIEATTLPERVAKETIKRLVLSGNRPAALDSLKSYILLQYNTQEVTNEIDSIIQRMEKNEEIKVMNEEVVYNF